MFCCSCTDGEASIILLHRPITTEKAHTRQSRRSSFGSAERIEHIVHKTYKDAVLLADEGTLPSPLLSSSPHSSSSHDDPAARAKPDSNGISSNGGADKHARYTSCVSDEGESRGLLIVVSFSCS